MRKKPISIRIKNWIIVNIINPIKYHKTKWCFDESECTNNTKDCQTCNYYINSLKLYGGKVMKFKIAKEPKKDTRKGYLLIIDTMIGDADGYDTVEVGCFQENELHLLEEVVNVCDRMIEAYPHGRGGYDDYNHVEGFERWFTDNSEETIDKIEHLAPFTWSYSPDGYGIQNSIEGYKVVYLDKGEEYEVKIIK